MLVAAAWVATLIRMRTQARRSQAAQWYGRAVRLRAGRRGRNRHVCMVGPKSTFRNLGTRMKDRIDSSGAGRMRVCRSAGNACAVCSQGINAPAPVATTEVRKE